MFSLFKDIYDMAKEFWIFWIPGLIVGIIAGYFLAFWPVAILITIITAFVVLMFSNVFGLTGEGGGLVVFFLCTILIGFALGIGVTAALVGTIPFSEVPLPSINFNWSWLFR